MEALKGKVTGVMTTLKKVIVRFVEAKDYLLTQTYTDGQTKEQSYTESCKYQKELLTIILTIMKMYYGPVTLALLSV